jgi:ElaB/YqjD/DUF883 family membrane-anchored ribosome-binding protein
MARNIESNRKGLVDDLSGVLTDAEDALKRAGDETGDKAKELRSQVESKLKAAKLRLLDFQDEAIGRAKAAATVTDDYVRDKPWQAMGVAALIGIAIGLLLNRRE